ncbi:MAG: HlyC/CorC family transporter [Deltaproteobacteria bacterium]|nr:HlyC/CorC family transporter [Deltaproteobacteria bacterium]
MTTVIIVLAICLLSEAFFSGSELALISADKVKLRNAAEGASPRRRRMILAFLDEPGDLISAALTGTNICVVLSTVTTTVALLPRFPAHAELISLGVIAPMVLVFGEILPKSIFQHYADQTAERLVVVLSWVRIAFLPVVALGRSLTTVMLRLMNIEIEQRMMTRDELRLLITLPTRKGADAISEQEQQMVSRVFDFSETVVEEVMLPLSEVAALPHDALAEQAAAEISEKRHTRLPVYRDRVDQIEGIVHTFDVLAAPTGAQVADLARPAIFVPENQPAVDTLVRLQREAQQMAVVVDEYGGAVGVVTVEDIIEEIVGDIRDEYDEAEQNTIRKISTDVYHVLARTEIDTFNKVTGIMLPECEDYETLAGLVLDRLERIPASGEQLVLENGITLTVTKASERLVEEVIVRRKTKR